MKFDGRQQPVGKTGSESRLNSRLDLMGLSASVNIHSFL